jgi:glycopeptide antibiotics resistance protein
MDWSVIFLKNNDSVQLRGIKKLYLRIINASLFEKVTLIYLILIIIVVMFGFRGDISEYNNYLQDKFTRRASGEWALNTIPFRTVVSYGSDINTQVYFNALASKIIRFMPMGFLFPIVFFKSKNKKMLRTISLSIALIITIELFKFVTGLGVADVDTIILGVLGVSFGYSLFIVASRSKSLALSGKAYIK